MKKNFDLNFLLRKKFHLNIRGNNVPHQKAFYTSNMQPFCFKDVFIWNFEKRECFCANIKKQKFHK